MNFQIGLTEHLPKKNNIIWTMDNTKYILGSHNSWSYLKPKKWWMRPFAFMARCQNVSIFEQVIHHDVQCLDLRIKFKNDKPIIAHNLCVYDINENALLKQLEWLNTRKNLTEKEYYVRVVLEVRNKREYAQSNIDNFKKFCKYLEAEFQNINFWFGRSLYKWELQYQFKCDPTCEERHASVSKPRLIDDWYPKFFAKRNNKKILETGTDSDILMIDFVDIWY